MGFTKTFDYSVSIHAFSESITKIKPKAFIELNYAINEVIYETNDEYKLWNRYRLFVIDESKLIVRCLYLVIYW